MSNGLTADLSIGARLEPGEFANGRMAAAIDTSVVLSASVELPCARLTIDGMAVEASVELQLEGGQLVLRCTPRVSKPKGGSLELTLPMFSGGGYLEKKEDSWQGAITARLGPVFVSGLAIVKPKAGQLSLLVLLTGEFVPPIQLSFGFTLAGVGGMVGIHRTIDQKALADAVSSGQLSRILFPRNLEGSQRDLLAAFDRCFPDRPDGILAGPFLKLCWGTPALVTATIGVVISSEGVLVLGRLAICLPFEQLDLIHIEATIIGTINEKGFALDASLANSSIVGMPITGDFKLRIPYEAKGGSMFALSAGGFHPAYPVPEGMGGMRRIGTEISPGPLLRARLEAYLAVTSNSVQFGALAQLTAGFDGFGIEGSFAFDALILFEPSFGFQAELHARVSVECCDFSVASLSLDGCLAGPAPFRISGHASISILFFDVDIDLPELVWGHSEEVRLPAARDPYDVLRKQIETASNWSTVAPDKPLVQLRPGAELSGAIHPLSRVAFKQSAVPLFFRMQRMDGVALPSPTSLEVHMLSLDEQQRIASELTEAEFVDSQFLDLTDDQRLHAGAYGVHCGGRQFQADAQEHAVFTQVFSRDEIYECKILPNPEPERKRKRGFLSLFDSARFYTSVDHLRNKVIPIAIADPGSPALANTSTLENEQARLQAQLATNAQQHDLVVNSAAGFLEGNSEFLAKPGAYRALDSVTKFDSDNHEYVARWELGA
jgi:hypothetical protein